MQIYNSLSKSKQPFAPIEPGKVSLYVCGVTVYDYCHIGHARAMIVFDVIVRYLRYRGYEVNYVRNITDIDDKIIQRAQQNEESWQDLTHRFIEELHADEQSLRLLPPQQAPQATQYLKEIIALIEKIIAQGYGYVADNGDVYFDVQKFKDYGKLSHRDLEKLRAGTRLEVNDAKREPLDFVLWKSSKPSEPSWPSPWGDGRPGWHIECSAMSTKLLGQPFDIHGGGMDLKFPHHENEIAQSEAAHDVGFANTWMHVGLLQINDEKMSKSLNNFLTIREVLEQIDVEVMRLFMISAHYRSPVNYSEATIDKMQRSLQAFYLALRDLPVAHKPADSEFERRFCQAMDDDFNTPEALAVMFDLAREINRLKELQDLNQAAPLGALLVELGGLLGILQHDPVMFLHGGVTPDERRHIESLIADRNEARRQKDWQRADALRDELQGLGILLEDRAEGTLWRKSAL